MFGRRKPEPPQRTVWADKTKLILDDVRKRRSDIVKQLDAEEQAAKILCNHTYPDGKSAIVQGYDSDDDRYYTYCSVCNY